MNDHHILVIGGGAAGMIAAWRAASPGRSVVLLEKNKKLGIKILISGGGKCNITNGSDIRMMLKQFEINESRFLKYSFHTFTNTHVLDLLHEQGVETYVREDGKVFPKSHDAEDVVNALQRMMLSAGVDIRLNASVHEISKNEKGIFTVNLESESIQSVKVIIATGGMSYQKTGTTGDGYSWLKKLGHTIVQLRPALAPIYLSPVPPTRWQGTPIRDCRLMAVCGKEIISDWHGDLLFTHLGISGPAALEVSKKAFIEFELGKLVSLCVDFFPEKTNEQLETNLFADITSNANRSILTLTEQYVPQRLAEYVLLHSNIDGIKKLHQFKKEERQSLVATLKNWCIGTVKEIPLDRGEVTAGGVALNEVEPTTMESKIVRGLYLCGEILDVAGPVGGYNLQAAFSTGYVAGESAAKTTLIVERVE
ncbi:MAG: NAD(P)/FAD-dependent oxidoreductase [Ignavibacteriales bacterium]|nr:NAD(P)/FAD-dependent oxidoreductase [Ignavibacteriales bacterium]